MTVVFSVGRGLQMGGIPIGFSTNKTLFSPSNFIE